MPVPLVAPIDAVVIFILKAISLFRKAVEIFVAGRVYRCPCEYLRSQGSALAHFGAGDSAVATRGLPVSRRRLRPAPSLICISDCCSPTLRNKQLHLGQTGFAIFCFNSSDREQEERDD
jgi:hypothetical protein